jgi:hypothetical protein
MASFTQNSDSVHLSFKNSDNVCLSKNCLLVFFYEHMNKCLLQAHFFKQV